MEAHFTITPEESGQRIERVCAARFDRYSRTQWQRWGVFTRGGHTLPGKTKARAQDVWHVSCQYTAPDLTYLAPWDFPLKVLAEGETWVVIEKPAGISVHPSPSAPDEKTILHAIVNQFSGHLSSHSESIDGLEVPRPGLVHRLDKPTSGCLLIAKTDTTHRWLQAHWPEVQKHYTALVQGTPPAQGRIEAALARDPANRTRMAPSQHVSAKDATTSFTRLETHGGVSLLDVHLHTGRTHQIRAHLSSIGFPILGDSKYNGPKAERLALHARTLQFPNPDVPTETVFVESPVPAFFRLS